MNLLTLSQVAQRLGISDRTVRHFREQLPGGVRVGRRIKYTEDAIGEFIRRGGCRPTGQRAVEAPMSA